MAGVYTQPSASNDAPNGLATTTARGPFRPAGATPLICVFESTRLGASTPPMYTLTNGPVPRRSKLTPLIVNAVPPALGPKSGVMPNTTGTLVGCGSPTSRKPSAPLKLSEELSAAERSPVALHDAKLSEHPPPPPQSKLTASSRKLALWLIWEVAAGASTRHAR